MPRENVDLLVFNRGLISKKALARKDLAGKIPFAAEVMKNWMPRSLGSMSLRPGMKYTGTTKDNAVARHFGFVYANDDTAIIEATALAIRVKLDEVAISRVSVSSTVANGNFTSNVSSWTNADESGATSVWATGGYLSMTGTGYNKAIMRQQVTVASGDQNKEHALDIVIERGPVTLKVGSGSGSDDYIAETSLGTGYHSLAFTPTGNFWIEFSSLKQGASLVDSVNVASAGDMVLTTPWTAADLDYIRGGPESQSADVIYFACKDYRQRRLERRGTRSWSLVEYEPEDGPFRAINTSTTRLTPSALTGDITLSASEPFFQSGHDGALFKITSTGQNVEATLNGADQFTDPIRVTGAGAAQRTFTFIRTGTWSATITLQRSVGDDSSWVDVTTYTTNGTTNYNDALDNQIIYYRLGIKTGNYTSGSVDIDIEYLKSGGITGICKITGVTNSTSASARVLVALGATTASEDWSEGAWSDYRGWPTAVSFFEGRLSWGGKGSKWSSVSDAFDSFDEDFEGDAGPINKSLGAGPVDIVSWMLDLNRLVLGAQGSEKVMRTSSLDEISTPSNTAIKTTGTRGSSNVPAIKIDTRGIFIEKSGVRVYEIAYNTGQNPSTFEFGTLDLTGFVPDIGKPSITRLDKQYQPDVRIHAVRSDGEVALNVNDPVEDVLCWCEIDTDGIIEDVLVLPGEIEDKTYYTVRRTINGSTVRYFERMATEDEVNGATTIYSGASVSTLTDLEYANGRYVTLRDASGNKIENAQVSNGNITLSSGAVSYAAITPTLYHLMDSYAVYNGTATTSPAVWNHLEGETIIVWADGKYVGEKTVSSGGITLDTAAQQVVGGLNYTAKWKSTKLAYAAGLGTAHNQIKRVDHLGFIMVDTHASGIKYGPDFNNLDSLPMVEDGATVDPDYVWPDYDFPMSAFDGSYNTDSRVCLQAQAGKPCTVTALVLGMKTNDKG